MVIGGQAMRAYGIDRQTRDLDLWVACDRANALALARSMRNAQNVPTLEIHLESLQLPNFKFTFGDPRRPEVDIRGAGAGGRGGGGAGAGGRRRGRGGRR